MVNSKVMIFTMGHKVSQLKEVDDAEFNITRVKRGRGFGFDYLNGERIRDKKLLSRLRRLVIPPMWTDVLISQWADGHVQATGRDKKGRKQYIYHDAWHRQQQQQKFKRLAAFGQVLPVLRKTCMEKVKEPEWTQTKVLLLVLEHTGVRIGHKKYTDENETYGLTTLRRKHLSIDGDQLVFTYIGKGQKDRTVCIDDPDLIQNIKSSAELPGYEIFRYQDKNSWHAVDSDEVIDHIKRVTGDDFYSKDFRTWVATRLAISQYPEALAEKKRKPRRKMTNILLRHVADEMGNTPTVCKDYYIHPDVFRAINDKQLPNLNAYQDENTEFGLSAAAKIILDVIS